MNHLRSKVRAVPEVEYVVESTIDGTAVNDDTFESATHAAHGAFIAACANRIADNLGVGALKTAAIHGDRHHLLLYQQKNRLISFIVAGSSQLGSVEQAVIKSLSLQKQDTSWTTY